MKKIILIIGFILASIISFAQIKGYTVTGTISVTADSLLIINGDTIGHFYTTGTDTLVDKSYVDALFQTIPGGHTAVTLGTTAVNGGMTLNVQELSMRQANTSQSGWISSGDWNLFYSKLSAVSHDNTLTGTGTSINILKVDTITNIASKQWVLTKEYITHDQLHYDSLTGTPTIPVISNDAYSAAWDEIVDEGASKNVIYDAIQAIGSTGTNLTYSAYPDSGRVNSDTGTDALIEAGSTVNASLMLPTDKIKLNLVDDTLSEHRSDINALQSAGYLTEEIDGDPTNEIDSFYSSNESRWIEGDDTLTIQIDTVETDIVKPSWEAWFQEVYESIVSVTVEGIYNEVPAGSIDGENSKFVLLNDPVTGTVRVYRNGVRQFPSVDYTVSVDEITFTTPPEAGDNILADYVLAEIQTKSDTIETPEEQSPLIANLVGVWPLNETSGTSVLNYGSNDLDGTSVSIDSLAKSAPANLGYSYDFDATSYLEWEDNNLFSFTDNSPFAISFWVKPTDMSNIRMFLTKSPGTTGEYLVHTTADKNVNFALFQQNTSTRIDYSTGSNKLLLNDWNHVVVSYDGQGLTTSAHIYVNGVDEALTVTGTEIPSGLSNTDNVVRFGKESDGQFSFIGYATQLALFNDTLSEYYAGLLYGDGNGLNHENWGITDTIPPVQDTIPGDVVEDTLVVFAGTGYYISSSTGDDTSGDGTIGNPYASIDKVNALTLSAGDAVLFKRGDEFEGTITPNYSGASGSPIIYAAYGTGTKPKIYNSVEVTGWTNYSGNIYKTTVTSDVKQLFIDDVKMKLARYPNEGYFLITSVGSTTQFTSTSLSSSISYTGATWVGRTSRYTLFHKQVTNSSSQTITLESAPTYSLGVGEGFFLTNKLEFLTEAGEWYYDSTTDQLYVWSPNGDSPANYTVRASTLDYGVNINSKNYISVENIEILHSGNTGVYVNTSSNVKVNNTKIVSPDLFGVYVSNGSVGGTFTNNYIYQTGCGIRCTGTSVVTIENNHIERIGQLSDINKLVFTHDNYGTGIYLRNNNPSIQYNTILNVGYTGINWKGVGIIKYNYINGACQVLDDGGGIYTYNSSTPSASSGSEVMYNIVDNVHGNNEGFSAATYDAGHGIYMDDATSDVDIMYNTVSNCLSGYFSHINSNIVIQYNTSFDNLIGLLASRENANSYFYDNIVYATNRLGSASWWTNSYERMTANDAASPVYNRNKYYHPYQTDAFRSGSNMNFAAWKSATGQDAASTFESPTLATGSIPELFYNNSMTSKTYSVTGTNVKDVDGTTVTGFTLAAFTSKILTGQNIVVTEIP